jgi:hypothetical protein
VKGFEKQLERIANKAELRAWIDELPDEAVGFILMRLPPKHHDACGKTHEPYKFREIGDITIEQTLYAMKSWEHWLFSDVFE